VHFRGPYPSTSRRVSSKGIVQGVTHFKYGQGFFFVIGVRLRLHRVASDGTNGRARGSRPVAGH
jgi:hypothetical protein